MEAMLNDLILSPDRLTDLCERHAIRRLALFGSALRDDFRPDSDLDILVDFEEGQTPDFFRFIEIQDELSGLFSRSVDLNTPAFLSRYFRDQVSTGARTLYERR